MCVTVGFDCKHKSLAEMCLPYKAYVPVSPAVVYVTVYVTMHGDLNNSRRHRRPKHVGILSHVCILLYLIIMQLWWYKLCGVKFVMIISHLDMSFTTNGINHKPFMKLELHSGKCVHVYLYVYLYCTCASTLFRIAETEFISFEVTNPKHKDIRNGSQHAASCINCIYNISTRSVQLRGTHKAFQ
jgi:hypothetical protein